MHRIPHRGLEKWGLRLLVRGRTTYAIWHTPTSTTARPCIARAFWPYPPHFRRLVSLSALRKCLVVRSARGSGGSVDPTAPAVRRCQGSLSLGAPRSAANSTLPTCQQPRNPLVRSVHGSPVATPHVGCAAFCCSAALRPGLSVRGYGQGCLWPAMTRRRPLPLPSPTIPVDHDDVAFEISYPGFSTPEHGSYRVLYTLRYTVERGGPWAPGAPWGQAGAQSPRLASNLYI